jgi:hypothetical protein
MAGALNTTALKEFLEFGFVTDGQCIFSDVRKVPPAQTISITLAPPKPFSVFTLTALGPKEAEMRMIGCDLHARQQTVAVLDTTTEEAVENTLLHGASNLREFYSTLSVPASRSLT